MGADGTSNTDRVYLDYTQNALDRAYDQSQWAPNMPDMIKTWSERGEECRKHSDYSEHAYGLDTRERIDVFDASGQILHFHIHGGAWRGQSKEGCSFLAPAMQSINVPFIVPEFGLLPHKRMPEVFAQIARALVWTYETFVATGRAKEIVISGHSSGAHMAALLASHDFGKTVPLSALRAVLCLSGSYDLAPVLLSARRNYIDLTPQEQRTLSPIERIGETRLPLHLLFGEAESPEFIRQSRAYAAALAKDGKLAACVQVPGANHFEMADQLASLDTPAGSWLRTLITMPHSASDLPPQFTSQPTQVIA